MSSFLIVETLSLSKVHCKRFRVFPMSVCFNISRALQSQLKLLTVIYIVHKCSLNENLCSIEALKVSRIFVFLVCSGEVFGFQSCECAGSVLHAVCGPPYRLHKEQPTHRQVIHLLVLRPNCCLFCNPDL